MANNIVDLFAVNPHAVFHIKGVINSYTVDFMLDTGAAVSLMDTNTWNTIKGTSSLTPWKSPGLIGVGGTPLRVSGTAKLQLELGGKQYQVEMVVADLRTEGILGLDFLETHQCAIDLSHGTMKLSGNNQTISLYRARNSSHRTRETVSVVLSNDLSIPGCTEMELEAVIQGDVAEGTVMIERKPLPQKSSLLLATSVVSIQEDTINPLVPIRLLNLSADSITVLKGTRVACAHALDSNSIMVAGVEDDSPTQYDVSDDKRQQLWQAVESTAEKLTESEQEQLYAVLLNYADVFADDSGDLGKADKLQHTINTGDALPIRPPPRRIPAVPREEVRKLLREMEEKRIIRPSKSPWASPVVLVKKKDGSTRFCVDYRRLNSVTHKDAYPLPRIDDTLQSLSGSKWFSTIDLLSRYWQVDITESDREKTAFITHDGLFEFNVMPFGLCNAPATFQRLMNFALSGMLWSECLVYLDDIVIFGRTFEEHLSHLASVLARLRAVNMKAKLSKCNFLKEQVLYLGHVISPEGISTDPSKTQRITEWPTPKSVQEVQQFLGLAGYYRRFVQNFAGIAKPLQRLTERGRIFKWTIECENAFARLKLLLSTSPILSFPDFSLPFILDTDACQCGIGAVLSQIHKDGTERVVAFASRAMSKSERKYSVTQQELLAAVTFINYFRQFLLGKHFVLRTDHGSLQWLHSLKEPEGQLARWLERLQEYNFNIQHRKGSHHQNADALSRHPSHHLDSPTMENVTSTVHNDCPQVVSPVITEPLPGLCEHTLRFEEATAGR